MKTKVITRNEVSSRENLIYATLLLTLWYFMVLLTPHAQAAKPDGLELLPLPSDTIQIIGGTQVSPKEALSQYIVAVYDTSSGGLCTASILQSRLILTAAHCVTNQFGDAVSPASLRILIGINLKSANVKVLGAEKVAVFPAWKERANSEFNTGDIALVKLASPLPQGFRSAAVLTSTQQIKKGSRVRLAGYGISDGVSHVGSGVLREVDVRVADPRFSQTEVLLDQRFGKGACHGDSGGPAYLVAGGRLLLFGVTSRGVKDLADDCSQFSAYTNMVAHNAWLTSQAQNLTGSSSLAGEL